MGGSYELEKKIGQGSSGYVWLGRDVEKEDIGVVIKIIPLSGWRKLEFEREVDALETLKHPNIVTMYDWSTKGKHGILVIELLDRDLLDFLDDFTINESEARLMFRQILSGIHHLHKNQVSHMDIKPENILIRGSDVLKIADLGSTHKWTDGSSVKTGKAGTSFYCAPEVKSGKPYASDKADIWSLGITLHVMMTGFWPYLGQTEKEVLANAKKGKVDLADQYLSPVLQEFMMLMLDVCPQNRPDIPSLLKHKWFGEAQEEPVAPKPDTSGTGKRVDGLDLSLEMDKVKKPFAHLEDLGLEGLKSPRACNMVTPRVNQLLGEEGMIRPSPRGNPNAKQSTKLTKFLNGFKKFGRK